jgi:hypothetical protein
MALPLKKWVEAGAPKEVQGEQARHLAGLREIIAQLLPDQVSTTTWLRGGPRLRLCRIADAIKVDSARLIQRRWRAHIRAVEYALVDRRTRINLRVTMRRFSANDIVFTAHTVEGNRVPLIVDIQTAGEIAPMFGDSTEAVLQCAYEEEQDKCVPLCVATGPVDSYAVMHPEVVEDEPAEEPVEKASSGPVMTVVGGQLALSFTTKPAAPPVPRPTDKGPRPAPPTRDERSRESPRLEAQQPLNQRHGAQPDVSRKDTQPTDTAEVAADRKPAGLPGDADPGSRAPPQYVPLSQTQAENVPPEEENVPPPRGSELNASIFARRESEAQKRIQERLANQKRFTFRQQEPMQEAENLESAPRARVARKSLVLRAKQELDNTQWSGAA